MTEQFSPEILDQLAGRLAEQAADRVVERMSAAANIPAKPRILSEFVAEMLPLLKKGSGRTYTAGVNLLVDGCEAVCACECAACLDTDAGCGCGTGCGSCPTTGRWAGAGDRPVHEVSTADVQLTVRWAQIRARKVGVAKNARRQSRGLHPIKRDGVGAEENAIAALRWLFAQAIQNKAALENPASAVEKPARTAAEPRSLRPAEIAELWEAAISGGDDPELDGLIVWSIIEMTLRRAGVLSMQVSGADRRRQMIRVCEKYGFVREQPCSASLFDGLLEHAADRGPQPLTPDSPLLYYKPKIEIVDGAETRVVHPLTERRFDTLLARLQKTLPWADLSHFRAHDLRHTSATMIDQVAGRGAAQRALGHRPKRPTDGYTQGRVDMVAHANEILTGEEHPLASGRHRNADASQ